MVYSEYVINKFIKVNRNPRVFVLCMNSMVQLRRSHEFPATGILSDFNKVGCIEHDYF